MTLLSNISEEPGYFGVIADLPQETDYQLVGGTLNLPQAKKCWNDNKIQYNQKEVQNFSCTIHGAIGALSDLTGYTFTLEERKELLRQALEQGFNPKVGWYVSKAVDLVRKFWNAKNPNQQVMTFRCDIFSQEATEAKDKGYSVVFSYSGNGAYTKDFQLDSVLDGTQFGTSTYGHCIRMAKNPGKDTAIDNYYPNQQPNFYTLPDKNIEALLTHRVLQSSGYIFVDKSDFDNQNTHMPQIPVWALASVNKAVNKGILHPADVNNPMTIGKIEDDLLKLGIFNSKVGDMDEKRWAVALDRLKAL